MLPSIDQVKPALELSTSKFNLQTAPKSGVLPLPLPYTTGFDPESTCSASCEWWCKQYFHPWCANSTEMCASLHCGGCEPCSSADPNPCGAPPINTPTRREPAGFWAAQWWVDQLASVTPHVTVEPSFQSNKVEYVLPNNQTTSDEPYIALQNYLLRTSGPSSHKSNNEYWLVGGDSWKSTPPSPDDMETCEHYLYRYQGQTCFDSKFRVFTPPTSTKWSEGTPLTVDGTWGLLQPGEEFTTTTTVTGDFRGCSGIDEPCHQASNLSFTSYSCKVDEGPLNATQMFGGKPSYAQQASRFGAYVYNSIPGYTKAPKPYFDVQIPLKAGASKRRLNLDGSFFFNMCAQFHVPRSGDSSLLTDSALCLRYLSLAIPSDVYSQCSEELNLLREFCEDKGVLQALPTCEDAFSGECVTLVANGQCKDAFRAKLCCNSCRRMNSGGSFDVTVLSNASSTHGGPVFMNLFFNSLLKAIRTDPSLADHEFVLHPNFVDLPVPAELRVSSWPFPRPISFTNLSNASFAFLLGIIISIALAFVPPTFALFIVREKEFKQRHQQAVSGLSPTIYWLSNFTYDFIALVALLTITFLCFVIAQVSGGRGNDRGGKGLLD